MNREMIEVNGVELWGIKDFYVEVFPLLSGDASVWDFGFVPNFGSRFAACDGVTALMIADCLGCALVFVGYVDDLRSGAQKRHGLLKCAPVLE